MFLWAATVLSHSYRQKIINIFANVLLPLSHLTCLEVLIFHQTLQPSGIPGPAGEADTLWFRFTVFNQYAFAIHQCGK